VHLTGVAAPRLRLAIMRKAFPKLGRKRPTLKGDLYLAHRVQGRRWHSGRRWSIAGGSDAGELKLSHEARCLARPAWNDEQTYALCSPATVTIVAPGDRRPPSFPSRQPIEATRIAALHGLFAGPTFDVACVPVRFSQRRPGAPGSTTNPAIVAIDVNQRNVLRKI